MNSEQLGRYSRRTEVKPKWKADVPFQQAMNELSIDDGKVFTQNFAPKMKPKLFV